MPAGVPVLLDLANRPVLVVGGGPVGEAKVRSLTAEGSGACITIVAPAVSPGLEAMVTAGEVRWHRRVFVPSDLDDAWLVVAATSSPQANAAVAREAEGRRIWCIRADEADTGTAGLLATVRRGPLLLGVSTSGTSPALAAHFRAELAARYGPEWGELATMLGELRRDSRITEAMAGLPAAIRRQRWHAIIDPDIVALIRLGRRAEAKEVAVACLCSSSD